MSKINRYIDHTLLKADATEKQIQTLCQEALEYDFYAVCVTAYNVKLAKKFLHNSNVKVCTVVGFPLGASHQEVKELETKMAIADGAQEIDMVINIAALKDNKTHLILKEIVALRELCHSYDIILKVIIETCLLNESEKRAAALLVKEAKADYIKTSTGFSTGGATIADVIMLKEIVGKDVKVKASGGVKTQEDAIKLINAGASRIGTSNGIAIVGNSVSDSSY